MPNEDVVMHESDAQKILDALDAAINFHKKRDESNAALHLAQETRYSPLTSQLMAEADRLRKLI